MIRHDLVFEGIRVCPGNMRQCQENFPQMCLHGPFGPILIPGFDARCNFPVLLDKTGQGGGFVEAQEPDPVDLVAGTFHGSSCIIAIHNAGDGAMKGIIAAIEAGKIIISRGGFLFINEDTKLANMLISCRDCRMPDQAAFYGFADKARIRDLPDGNLSHIGAPARSDFQQTGFGELDECLADRLPAYPVAKGDVFFRKCFARLQAHLDNCCTQVLEQLRGYWFA